MVIRMAITPSLNASSRPVRISYRHIRSGLRLKRRDHARGRWCRRRRGSRRSGRNGLNRCSVVETVSRTPNFPAAAEGPVRLDQALRDFAACLSQRVLLEHETLFELRDSREVDRPRLVLHESKGHSLLGFVDADRLQPRPRLGPQERHEAVFRFLVGIEHRLLISGDQFLELRILQADVIQDSAVVENLPIERRTDRPLEGAGAKSPGNCSEDQPTVPRIEMAG